MIWKRVRIETSPEAADLVSGELLDAGAAGTEIRGGTAPMAGPDEIAQPQAGEAGVSVIAYFGENDIDRALRQIGARIEAMKDIADIPLGPLSVEVEDVPDTDWNENFKAHFQPFRAADGIVVKPTWAAFEAEPGDVVIEIDPGMAFGSGEHETTKMCLALAHKHMRSNAAVLDVGCGSGILGIACAKMGAERVLALDYDATSVEVAQKNAAQNGVENLAARQSDLLQNADGRFDLVLANIIADIVIRLNTQVREFLNPGAVYVLSGIIEERLGDVLASLQQNGFEVIETMAMADWRAVAARSADA